MTTASYPKKLTRLAKLAAEYAAEVNADEPLATTPTLDNALDNALDFLYNRQGLTDSNIPDDDLDIVLERYIDHLNGDTLIPRMSD